MINKIKKIHMLRIEKDSDLLKSVNDFITTNKIQTGFISGIGAVRKLNIAYFENRKYNTIEREGVFEVGSCKGNIAIKDGNPFVHMHIVCQDSNGNTVCGHVMEGCIVHPTLEFIIFEFKNPIKRKWDEDVSLFIWDI